MNCIDDIIKFLILIFNLLFSVAGIILVVVGSMLLSNTTFFSKIVKDLEVDTRGPQIFVIALGIIIFLISAMGYWGVYKENRLILIIFSAFLLFIFFVQLSGGIYIFLYELDYTDSIEKGLLREFNKINTRAIKENFGNMEKTLDCCGVKGESDYTLKNMTVPITCCVNTKCDSYWKKGCALALDHFITKAGMLLGSVTAGLCIFEFLEAIFAIRLAVKVKASVIY